MVDAIYGMQQALSDGKLSPRQGAENGRQFERAAGPASPARDDTTPETADDKQLQGRALEGLADRAAKELAETQPFFRPELEFKVDEESGRTVITVYHPETEEVIRQIPPEQALKLAQMLREQQKEGSGADAASLIDTRA